ncbi:hypothetical protein SAMN02745227_01652 [Anaerobranca californiensis DSM 14826]|uniref:Haloacid dehalogenase-like hydrolase n=1 Tax=Anaerobranca californiensis DSM 14826 TaxID=1120989 RepID=A0A1M6Q558_9FIRM|nr:Cof-type HAD-IIB family hydrolase [Anaerobranca californiensis]SHK15399.1 hypothetical protein SAMN02745227_01652 [Anaerobranca californiensis DSM 14826]
MFKLIALDIDGTLINSDGKISIVNKKIIKTAQNQGYLITLNTGRSFYSAYRYAEELGIDIPIITANGTLIRDPKTFEVKYQLNFPQNIALNIARYLSEKKGISCQGYHLEGILLSGVGLVGLAKLSSKNGLLSFKRLIGMYEESKRSKTLRVKDFVNAVANHGIQKFFVAAKADTGKEIEKELANFPCTVETHYEGANGYLEIIPQGASKGEGLKKLASMYNISLEETIAVGDSANDVSMFQVAGLSVAMANGTKYAKSHAKHITFSNVDDGVAAVIKEFMLTPVKDFKFIKKAQ